MYGLHSSDNNIWKALFVKDAISCWDYMASVSDE
jgi:hypothetical protein